VRTVFVGGPIQYAICDNGIFRNDLKEVIENILEDLNTNNYKVLSAHRYENYGEMDMANLQLEVCKRDFEWMNLCDIFIAVMLLGEDGKPLRTDGTCVELGWAAALGKKIIIIYAKNATYSHLIYGLYGVASVHYLEIQELRAQKYNISSVIGEITTELPPLSLAT
jgi:nucleoside 2-deoxyribosyltransferase